MYCCLFWFIHIYIYFGSFKVMNTVIDACVTYLIASEYHLEDLMIFKFDLLRNGITVSVFKSSACF